MSQTIYQTDWQNEKVYSRDEWKAMGTPSVLVASNTNPSVLPSNRLSTARGVTCWFPFTQVTDQTYDNDKFWRDHRNEATIPHPRPTRGQTVVHAFTISLPESLDELAEKILRNGEGSFIFWQMHSGARDQGPDGQDAAGRGPNLNMTIRDGENGGYDIWWLVRGDARKYTGSDRSEIPVDSDVLIKGVHRGALIGLAIEQQLNYDGSQVTRFYRFNPFSDAAPKLLATTTEKNIYNDESDPYYKLGIYAIKNRQTKFHPLDVQMPLGSRYGLKYGPMSIELADSVDNPIRYVRDAVTRQIGGVPLPDPVTTEDILQEEIVNLKIEISDLKLEAIDLENKVLAHKAQVEALVAQMDAKDQQIVAFGDEIADLNSILKVYEEKHLKDYQAVRDAVRTLVAFGAAE